MKITLWLASLFSLAISASVMAEVLEIPQPETINRVSDIPQPEAMDNENEIPEADTTDIDNQPADIISITLPGKGMTKDAVEERFGSPVERIEAVGEPPISRWIYGSFTVYFEYDHVIHAVNRK